MMIDNNNIYFFARVFSDTNLYKVEASDTQEFKYGAEIVIKTEFGENIAVITSWKTEDKHGKSKFYPSGKLIRYATIEDKAKRLFLDKKSNIMKSEINTFVQSFNLSMSLTNILIPLSESSICIYYVAKERVDFRKLLVKLKDTYKTKVILRQINGHERASSYLFSTDLFVYNKNL